MKTDITREAHITTVSAIGAPGMFGEGPHRIDCTVCGHVHTYSGRQFTDVEAQRHENYFNNKR